MADPVTLGLGAMAGSAAIGALGSLWQGGAQANQYRYQAGIASMNAQIAQRNKDYAIAEGEVKAQQQGMKTRAEIGTTRATQGASGLDVNKGSAVEVRASEADIGAENQALTRYDAAKKGYAFDVAAMEDTAQSKLFETSASTSETAGELGAAQSILGGASSVSTKWVQAKQAGPSSWSWNS